MRSTRSPLRRRSAGLADDRPEPVDFCFRVRPEGEAVGVAAAAWFLVETDEGTRLAVALGGIGDFGLRGADLRETERREEDVVKLPSLRKVGDP